MRHFGWVLTVLLAFIGSRSSSQTLVYSGDAMMAITGTGTISTTSITPPTPKFPPALGQLTSVSIFFKTNIDATFDGQWMGANGAHDLTLSTIDTLSIADESVSFNGSETRHLTLTNGGVVSIHFAFGGGKTVAAANLAEFIGSGSVPMSWKTQVSLAGQSGFQNSVLSGLTKGTVTTTYTYLPVPEPGTIIILGFGSVLLIRKREKKS